MDIMYRKRRLSVDLDLVRKYSAAVHAPVETHFFDSAIHRKYMIDVTCDDDICDLSEYEISEVVSQCMAEDIEAVRRKQAVL